MKKYTWTAVVVLLLSANLVCAEDTWTPRVSLPDFCQSVRNQLSQIWDGMMSYF